VVAIWVLALGIAGITAMFSLLDAVRLRALPYPDAERLVVLWGNVMRTTLERAGVLPGLRRLACAVDLFRGHMAAGDETRMTLSVAETHLAILVKRSRPRTFPLLRATPAVGRTFAGDEDVVPQKVASWFCLRCVLAPGVGRDSAGCRSGARP
jgi:hypothetical protein